MSASVVTCPACKGPTGYHCENLKCTWWRCKRCGAYGNQHGRWAKISKAA